MKTIANIFAAILILFGVLFILGAFSEQGGFGYLITGIVIVGIATATSNARLPSHPEAPIT